jgi:hypothetical protein
MSDEIYKLEPSIRRNKRTSFMFIINTDDSSKLGSHWMAYFISIPNKKIYFYDSLSINGGKPIPEQLKEIRGFFGTGYKVYWNRDQDQSNNSGSCGYYALNFLVNMANGMSFRKASDMTELDISDWARLNGV